MSLQKEEVSKNKLDVLLLEKTKMKLDGQLYLEY